jgi:uncharacterized protein DUF4112
MEDSISQGTVRRVEPKHHASLETLRRWSYLLDSAFRVPGTRFRFGWDPIIGLIPGLGDALTGLLSCLILLHAFQMRIPKVVQVRMVFNVIIDVLAGAVPVVGDAFDFAWKSNKMNMQLLERHAYEDVKPSAGDWIFVGLMISLLVLCIAVPLALFIWLLMKVPLT